MGRRGPKPMEPTAEDRTLVETMSAVGIPQESIARCICGGISVDTLARHFREELDTAATLANAKVAGTLFNKALDGDVTAMIWWTKTRMSWKETKVAENHNLEYVARLPVVAGTADEWHQRYQPTLQ